MKLETKIVRGNIHPDPTTGAYSYCISLFAHGSVVPGENCANHFPVCDRRNSHMDNSRIELSSTFGFESPSLPISLFFHHKDRYLVRRICRTFHCESFYPKIREMTW